MSPNELVEHKTHLLYRRYAPDTKDLDMWSEVNVMVKVTQNGMHLSAIPRVVLAPNLGFLPQIILEICSRHNYSRN